MVEPSCHGDEQLPGLLVLEEADGEVAFMAGDVEFVGDRGPGVGQPAAQGFVGAVAQLVDFGFKFLNASLEGGGQIGGSGGVGGGSAFGIERLRALGAIAVNGHALEPIFQACT